MLKDLIFPTVAALALIASAMAIPATARAAAPYHSGYACEDVVVNMCYPQSNWCCNAYGDGICDHDKFCPEED